MSSLMLFGSAFLTVLLLGFQSQVVRDKQKYAAFFTSIGIGVTQVIILKGVPAADSMETFFFILGGACGIVASIELHNIWLKVFPPKKAHLEKV